MHDDLVKRLWECTSGECFNCSQYTPTTNASVCQKELMKQASNAIEKLQTYLDLYEDITEESQRVAKEVIGKYPKWIPVEERLPEKAGKYLVCGQWREKQTEIWVCEFMTLGYSKGWANNAANPCVSHWTPLPELPKEE